MTPLPYTSPTLQSPARHSAPFMLHCVQFDFTREARVMDTIALHLAPVADRIQASDKGLRERGGGSSGAYHILMERGGTGGDRIQVSSGPELMSAPTRGCTRCISLD